MLTLTSLRIYVVTALVAVAVPFYVRFAPSSPSGEPPYPLARVCMFSMIPALYLTVAVLPSRYSYIGGFDDDDPVYHARIAFSVLVAMNVLFWTATSAIVVLVVRRARKNTHAISSI